MGKATGFAEWEREEHARRDKVVRLRDYREVYLPASDDHVRKQGGRCMDCGVPFCQQGCPLGNLIPDWNDLVYRGRWRDAWRRLASTNNFPEFTGRLCPAPCEGACVLAVNSSAVTIEEIEKEIIEHAWKNGWVVPQPPRQRSGRRIAVVGSGPAGLAAAAQLNSVGHLVTVFEAADRIGGLLRYGIPDFKMEKWVIERRLEVMHAEGIDFVTGVRLGEDRSWADLRAEHDAVLVATGARRARDLPVPGRELAGVHFAMDFLTRQNRIIAGEAPGRAELDAHGKRVIVLGGGDTGSDCLGTTLRQGAKKVHQIELLPMPPGERARGNPWPQWPMIMRTSSSQEEGGERDFAVMSKRLSGSGGKLERLHGVRLEAATSPDGTPQLREVAGSEFEIRVDLLILALGFLGPETTTLVDQLGVEVDARGNLKTDASYATNVPGVFAAGDARRGQSLIVWAISEGREAARAVDSHLREGAPAWLPTRGADAYFGGR